MAILQQLEPEVEIYSIDEAFLHLPKNVTASLREQGWPCAGASNSAWASRLHWHGPTRPGQDRNRIAKKTRSMAASST